MQVTWLGQGGLFFETADCLKILIDPYLSDSMEKERGISMKRLIPVDARFLELRFDVLILTHIHGDHTDLDTLDRLIPAQKKPFSVLAPLNVWSFVRERYAGAHNYIQFDRGIEVTLRDTLFCSITTAHSDERAIGVRFTVDGLAFYVTGDTLYTKDIIRQVTPPIDYMFTVINGYGNNMNAVDAARLTKAISPRHAIPVHWDMFRDFSADPQEYFVRMEGSPVNVFSMEQFKALRLN
jgi:L-ascorbate 6-phosphate lactonase